MRGEGRGEAEANVRVQGSGFGHKGPRGDWGFNLPLAWTLVAGSLVAGLSAQLYYYSPMLSGGLGYTLREKYSRDPSQALSKLLDRDRR